MTDPHDQFKTRRSLLDGIKDPNNQRRWTDFYDMYSKLIQTVGIRMGLRYHEAEDLVQIVLIELSHKIEKYSYDSSKGKFRSWLCTIVKRRAIDMRRKRRPAEENKAHRAPNDTRNTGTLDRLEDSSYTGMDLLMDDEWNHAVFVNTLKAVREKVGPEQYQIYDAYVLKEWPVEKVKRVLGASPNKVYKAKSRIYKIIKQVMPRIAADMDTPDIPPPHPTDCDN